MHPYMYIYTYVCTCTYIYMYTCIHICIHMCTYMFVCMNIFTRSMYVCEGPHTPYPVPRWSTLSFFCMHFLQSSICVCVCMYVYSYSYIFSLCSAFCCSYFIQQRFGTYLFTYIRLFCEYIYILFCIAFQFLHFAALLYDSFHMHRSFLQVSFPTYPAPHFSAVSSLCGAFAPAAVFSLAAHLPAKFLNKINRMFNALCKRTKEPTFENFYFGVPVPTILTFQKFSNITSQLHTLRKLTIESTFEKCICTLARSSPPCSDSFFLLLCLSAAIFATLSASLMVSHVHLFSVSCFQLCAMVTCF